MSLRQLPVEDMAPDQAGRAADLPALPAGGEGALFDAILYPHRSLPNTGFLVVMGVIIGANVLFGLYFYLLGAWPVIGFMGLDVFLVWLAFRLSYRQGRLLERVRVTPDALSVSRVLPSGHEARWRLHPFWTQVHVDFPGRPESRVRVVSKGRTLVLGAFLSPPERGEFAQAFAAALARLRRPG